MRAINRILFVCFTVASLAALWSCTESPFGEDIAPEPREIRGQVDLLGNSNDAAVYVWLEGLNIATRTDEEGFFDLEIPKELSESTSQLHGLFRLYFYVANYKINTADIAVRGGLYLYGERDLDSEGNLREVITLEKILDIDTIVEPVLVSNSYDGPIDVQVTLQATHDSVTVIYPKSIGGLLGAVLLKHVDTEQIFVDVPDAGATTRAYEVIGNEPTSRRLVFQLNGTNFRDLFLPVGYYTVIPYFLIEHDELPQELLDTMGQDVQQIGPNFLKIPYDREGGTFRVTN